MSDDVRFYIVEKFVSIDGEGLQAGRPAAFIRFMGCNLRCAWCDTSYSWFFDDDTQRATADELLDWIRSTGVHYVTITGGEPLMMLGMHDFIEKILQAPEAYYVEIETNGSREIEPFIDLRTCAPGTLSFTLDRKLPSSNNAEEMLDENYPLMTERDCLKMVIGSEEDLLAAERFMEQTGVQLPCQIVFSTVFDLIEPERVVTWMIDKGYFEARFQLQMHKFIWPRDKRGV